jgi:uncharacterized surface protein with fasciclin (FAS1) repeats
MKLTSHMKKIVSYSLVALLLLSSCNKDIPAPVPNTFPTPTGQSIGEIVNTNTSFSLLKYSLNKAGLLTALTNKNSVFTVFAPNDAAFALSGFGTTAAIDQIPVAQLTAILNYHLIPGQKITSAAIPTTFPNVQMPTGLIFPPPNTSPLARFSIFPSRRGTAAWANNIPVTAADIAVAHGVIHQVAAIIAPPSKLLLDTIKNDPDLDYFEAALVRADSGLATTAAPSFQYYLGNPTIAPGANFTVFAPNNAAFQALIYFLVYQQVFALTGSAATADAQANGAVAAGPAFLSTNNVTTALVRGVVAYHIMTQRAFSVNFTSTATNYQTFVNASIAAHPGIAVSSTITSGFGSALSVKGVGNPSAAAAIPTAAGIDRPAVNGNFFKINQVLLPQ